MKRRHGRRKNSSFLPKLWPLPIVEEMKMAVAERSSDTSRRNPSFTMAAIRLLTMQPINP
jgi:hypothetical protein